MYEDALNYAFAETEKSNNVIQLRNKYEKIVKIVQRRIEDFNLPENVEPDLAYLVCKKELTEANIIAEALRLLEDKRWSERSVEDK